MPVESGRETEVRGIDLCGPFSRGEGTGDGSGQYLFRVSKNLYLTCFSFCWILGSSPERMGSFRVLSDPRSCGLPPSGRPCHTSVGITRINLTLPAPPDVHKRGDHGSPIVDCIITGPLNSMLDFFCVFSSKQHGSHPKKCLIALKTDKGDNFFGLSLLPPGV